MVNARGVLSASMSSDVTTQLIILRTWPAEPVELSTFGIELKDQSITAFDVPLADRAVTTKVGTANALATQHLTCSPHFHSLLYLLAHAFAKTSWKLKTICAENDPACVSGDLEASVGSYGARQRRMQAATPTSTSCVGLLQQTYPRRVAPIRLRPFTRARDHATPRAVGPAGSSWDEHLL